MRFIMKARTIRRLSGFLLVTLALQACGEARSTVANAPVGPVPTDFAPASKPPDETLPKLTPAQIQHEIDLKKSDAGAPASVVPEFPPQGIYSKDVDAPVPSGIFLPTSEAVVILDDRVVEIWAGFDGRDNPTQGSVFVVVLDRKSGKAISTSIINAPVGVGSLIATSIAGAVVNLKALGGELLSLDAAAATLALR